MQEGNVNDKARMSDPVQEETALQQVTELEVLQGLLDTLKTLIYYVSRPMYIDGQTGRMKVQLESGTGASVNLNASQTLATLTTLNQLSGIDAREEVYSMNRASWNANVGVLFH